MNWLKRFFNCIFIYIPILAVLNASFTYAELIEGAIRKEIKHTEKKEIQIPQKEPKYSTGAIMQYNKGVEYFHLDEYDKSIQAFKTAIKQEPRFSDAYFNLGILYDYFKNTDSAIIAFNKAYLTNKKDYEALFYMVKCYVLKGNLTIANHYLKKIPKDNDMYIKAQSLLNKEK